MTPATTDDPLSFYRDDKGKLATYTSIGCYPLFYLAADNGVLCPDCANGENGSECLDPPDDQWRLVLVDVHWEGPPLTCEHCNGEIESAYGDPDIDDITVHYCDDPNCPIC